ncbi:hypothetical protein CYMTET_29072 [Cymbomonas tetramitiformis]|uniref:Reverse transcriptase Ty1/copia-type domain-containing protein n=1 Tax=Cymbomonas tetramitiformis TaxID=36881 RepID=A0AAE0FLI8_9CHLO|nr:hypothetical protein CYMTET_29072 [Cymbomonas tetramitiformis]
MACGAHDDPPPRDKTNWKFEDTETHFETHGPFNFELFADEDNHILPVCCTSNDSCFGKEWAGLGYYPLFIEVTVNTDKEPEAVMVCARAADAQAYPYCVVLLTNFTYMDVAAGKALAAQDSAKWLEAIQAELEALVKIKKALLMIKEEDVPYGYKLLDMSLVLRVKLDKYRQLLKRKARICAKGNKQEYGVDYLDTFAPCTQLSSVRMVIILALNLGLTVYHMDVGTAFLNFELDEDLYVRLPHGLQYNGYRCAKLLKAVYGLKQGGKEWFETRDAFIMAYDSRMQRSNVEPCLYYIRNEELSVRILAYVDDYIVATNDKLWYDTFFKSFHAKYPCKDLGVLDLVMGVGVRWAHGAAYLSQSGYITQMIETYGLRDAKPASLPMTVGSTLTPSDGKNSSLPCCALLGQLHWIARCTRPDIMAAVSALSRFCTTYGEEHFVALKQVVRYLKGTLDYEMVMRRASMPGGLSSDTTALPVCIYTDADYAGCKSTRKSTSGIAMFLCGSLVIFSSMIQRCVSLSTTEAEIIAMSEGAREIKYILNVLDSIVNIHKPIPMYCDNQGAINLASDYVNNSRSKHIEVRNMYIREQVKEGNTEPLYIESMYIREQVKEGNTEPLYIESADNTSDIFTKPLPLPAFQVHRERLGIMNLERDVKPELEGHHP